MILPYFTVSIGEKYYVQVQFRTYFLRNSLGSSCHLMNIFLNSATLQKKLIGALSLSKNI